MLSGTYTQTQIAERFGIDQIPETEVSTHARLVWLNSEKSLHRAWAGYSAGSGNPQRLPLVRESGSHACYSPQSSHSQFGSQYFGVPGVSCRFAGYEHFAMRAQVFRSWSVRTIICVCSSRREYSRSRDARAVMPKFCLIGCRMLQINRSVHTPPYPKMLTGNPGCHHPETITGWYTHVCNRFL